MTAQSDDHTQVPRDPNPAPQAGCAKDELRTAQADLVMPQIGPLLDAWHHASNDVRGTLLKECPELGLNLDNISAAMEHAEPPLPVAEREKLAPTVQTKPGS